MIEKKQYMKDLERSKDHPCAGLERVRNPQIIEKFEESTGKLIGLIDNSPYYQIRLDLFRNIRTGKLFRYCNVAYPEKQGAAVLVLLHCDNEAFVLLECNYRIFLERYCYEIPRGFANLEDRTSKLTALRELKEETGLDVSLLKSNIKKLGSVTVDSGLTNNTVNIYVVDILIDTIPYLINQNREDLIAGYKLVPIQDMEKYIKLGTIQDSFTLNALFLSGQCNNR